MRKKLSGKKQRGNPLKKIAKYGSLFLVGVTVVAGAVGLARLVTEDSRISQIAKHFHCICEMDCSLLVAHCQCTKPGGASDVKKMIRQELRHSLSENEIILRVNQKYGGLIA